MEYVFVEMQTISPYKQRFTEQTEYLNLAHRIVIINNIWAFLVHALHVLNPPGGYTHLNKENFEYEME